MTDYTDFVTTKLRAVPPVGITRQVDLIDGLFPHQIDLVRWALRRGRAAIFADTGLGKTRMQVAWADVVQRETGGDLLILAPLAVAQQMGKVIPANYVATNTCGNPRCVAPDHLLIASRSKLGKLTDARTGFTRTPQRRKKISDSKRATAKLNPDAVQAIRAAKSSVKAAQKYGIAKATAIRIRAYESWRDYSSPFAALMGRQ